MAHKNIKIHPNPNPNWSELPTELLEQIAKNFSYFDILRFKSVCRSWKKAAKFYMQNPRAPLLLIPQELQKFSYGFIDFTEKQRKVYKLNKSFQGVDNRWWCIGSSYGWLVIMDQTSNLHVINPFSGKQFPPLPPLDTIPYNRKVPKVKDFRWYNSDQALHRSHAKAILLSDPSQNPNSNKAVITIYGCLAYCNLVGDKEWTNMEPWTQMDQQWKDGDRAQLYGKNEYFNYIKNHQLFDDILLHNGLLYALSDKYSLQIWDFESSGDNFPTMIREIKNNVPRYVSDAFDPGYLVESNGEISVLLFVYKSKREVDKFQRGQKTVCLDHTSNGEVWEESWKNYYSNVKWHLLKIGMNGKVWEEVESLEEQALFVGENQHSFLISTRDFPEFEENSIYFSHPHTGIYNLKTKDYYVRRLFHHDMTYFTPFKPFKSIPLPVWVVPNSWW